jgi:hypothetical protein
MSAIAGLVLHGGLPPGIEVEDVVGAGEVHADAPARRLSRKTSPSPAWKAWMPALEHGA